MDEPSPLAAQDAAEALIALGWPIQPHGPEMDRWRISSLILTDDELSGLAIQRGTRPASERVQWAMAKEPPQTIGDTRRKAIVMDMEIAVAVQAYLADPKARPFEFVSGYALDEAVSVGARRPMPISALEALVAR